LTQKGCPTHFDLALANPGQPSYTAHFTTRSTGIGVTRLTRPTSDVERKTAMDAKELTGKTPDELRQQLVNLKKEAFNLRFQQATGQLENTARMRTVRRDVARVKTILNQKAAAAASEA
jgi:large subunit ribosomal protein L29